jgi:hypothetical protein
MIYTTKKNHHYSKPRRLGIWFKRTTFRWRITFDDSSEVNLEDGDQLDINKIVGIGFSSFFELFKKESHHQNSIRIGWRWNVDANVREIFAYVYSGGGKPSAYHLIDLHRNDKCFIACLYIGQFSFKGVEVVILAPKMQVQKRLIVAMPEIKNKIRYRLGTYFGGNKRAPHDIKIKVEPI